MSSHLLALIWVLQGSFAIVLQDSLDSLHVHRGRSPRRFGKLVIVDDGFSPVYLPVVLFVLVLAHQRAGKSGLVIIRNHDRL